MAIIVEDGSLVAGANSFVSLATYQSYAAAMGITGAAEVELIKAGAYLNSLEASFLGVRVDRDQAMAWPRQDENGDALTIAGFTWERDEIPTALIKAQMELALEVKVGTDLYNIEPRQAVTKERVEGAVEVTYAAPAEAPAIRQTAADSLLRSLMKRQGLTIPLKRA